MRVGYACLTIGIKHTDYKKVLLKQVSEAKLRSTIVANLTSLKNVIHYNIKNQITLFRISSDLIPFGSSSANPLRWWEDYAEQFKEIGKLIQQSKMRVSLHPGQYTVLNSPNEDVVNRAILDLEYHAQILESLGVDYQHKLILHIGGVYGDKEQAIARFLTNYDRLSLRVQQRLVIENDDKSYTIEDVLAISKQKAIPVVYDNLHNAILPSNPAITDAEWITRCAQTWRTKDGPQKIHYSQQALNKRLGSHSSTIHVESFQAFYERLPFQNLDIMLEVKDKNLSAIKIHRLVLAPPQIKNLEEEWRLYKYLVLEKSQQHYQDIRFLLQNKANYPAFAFYQKVEEALELAEDKGQASNAAMHVWGYVKQQATIKEKTQFFDKLKRYQSGQLSLMVVKNYLQKLLTIYQQTYVVDSYYFINSQFFIEGEDHDGE